MIAKTKIEKKQQQAERIKQRDTTKDVKQKSRIN